MFDLDKWSEIWATIKKHKVRTALTAFGVFWGIFMLTLLLGAGKGFENGVMQNFDVAKNSVFVWGQRTSIAHKGLKAGRFVRFTNDDIEAIKQEVPEVAVIAPRIGLEGNFTVNRKEKKASFQVNGEKPEYVHVRNTKIVEGRFINQFDINEKRKVCVIGTEVVKILFKDTEKIIGEYIKIKGVFFKIVGVFKGNGKGEEAREEARTIFMPITTLQYSFNQINRIWFFAMTPKEGIPAATIEQKVKLVLAKKHYIHPKDERAIGSANVEIEYQQVQGLFSGIRGFSWIVSIGTIIAGVIGVGNIMLIVVKERTREIGVRKALGATPMSIISLIIQESLVLTSVAGYLGLLLGTSVIAGIAYLMNAFDANAPFFANPEVDFNTAFAAMIVLVITGVLAGLLPAAKAARVNPVLALKDE